MTTTVETSVLVVGGGPVGLTVAMDLASRGVDVTVAEQRAPRQVPTVRCNHISARSMETYRRLGVADTLRAAGLPDEHPHDAAFRTTVTGIEFARIPIPGRKARPTATDGPDSWWPTPEPPHRINQIYMEPILYDHAAAMDRIRLLNRVSIGTVEQDGQAVSATATDLNTGTDFRITGRFLVGCDGGKSTIRKAIGARLEGDAEVQRVQSTYIRAPGLTDRMQAPPAWSTVVLNPRRSGTLYAIDGRETWLVHNYLRPDEEDFEAIDRDTCIRTILGVDDAFDYEIIQKEDWIGRRLVADAMRDRRVFLCGDAAHIWVPYAGYGMNAGIADATDLAWILAAHLNGWAAAGMLDAYEAERLPITTQVSHFAMDHAHKMISRRRSVPAKIEAPGPEGDAVRAQYGQENYDLNVQQYCCGGLNFGYYYDRSPIIAYDGELQPDYGMADFTPSTVPGCRVPHIWIGQGRSLYDVLGDGYTMFRFDPSRPVDGLRAAARASNVPLDLFDIDPDKAAGLFDRDLVLSRPDQHVAWRGNREPSDPFALIERLRGAANTG